MGLLIKYHVKLTFDTLFSGIINTYFILFFTLTIEFIFQTMKRIGKEICKENDTRLILEQERIY